MKKKILSFVLAICMIIPCAWMLAACKKTEEPKANATTKVMNVGLNPKIEFVLNQDDKVLSVNALNEDGNHIISISLDSKTKISGFEGLTADEAVELFLSITEDNGYLITGDAEKVSIEISGEAEDLLKKVKNRANKFLSENGFTIEVATDFLQKTDLLNEVQQCVQEYTQKELEWMTEEQLIDLLKKSRQETKNLLTQELKDAYYNMRAEKINIAELEKLLEIVEGFENETFDLFKSGMEILATNMQALEDAYKVNFLDEESSYNLAKQAYIQAKEALLAKRLELGIDELTEKEITLLAPFEQTVADAEAALTAEKAQASLAIATAKATLEQALKNVQSSVAGVKTMLGILGANLDALNHAKQNIKENFKGYFANHEKFADFVGHGHWNQVA